MSDNYLFHLYIPEKCVKEGISPRVTADRLLRFMDKSDIDICVPLPFAPYVTNEYIYRVVTYEP